MTPQPEHQARIEPSMREQVKIWTDSDRLGRFDRAIYDLYGRKGNRSRVIETLIDGWLVGPKKNRAMSEYLPLSIQPGTEKWYELLGFVLNSGNQTAIKAVTANLIAFAELVNLDVATTRTTAGREARQNERKEHGDGPGPDGNPPAGRDPGRGCDK